MLFIPFLFTFLFVGMWVFIVYFLSNSAWVHLVAKFKFTDQFVGKRIGIISARINYVNYNNSLILYYNEKGFYLKPVFIFKLFHPPIFIPWNEVQDIYDKKILFFKYKELWVIGHPNYTSITISDSTFKKLESSYQNSKAAY